MQPENKPRKAFLPSKTFRIAVLILIGIGLGIYGTTRIIGRSANLVNPPTIPVPSNTTKTPTVEQPVPPTDPTVAWTKYASPAGKFSLRYAPNWQIKVCDATPQTLYLGPSTKSVAVCSSGFGGQMMITSSNGDSATTLEYGAGYSDKTDTSVVVDGITGKRQTATVVESAGPGPEPGTKLAQYIFFAHGKTYSATYQQRPSGDLSQNVLDDFDLMVKNTLKFSS